MTASQNAYFQMLAAVKALCEANTPVWSATPSFAMPYGLLKAKVIDQVPTASAQQQQASTGVTIDKQQARAAVEAQLESLSGAIVAYAISTGNDSLRKDAYLTHSAIARAEENEFLGMETKIAALANANLAALTPFGVNASRITALTNAATAFVGWLGKPRDVIAAKKGGTDKLDALVALARTFLDSMDGQMILFKATAADFYSQYFTVRKIVEPASHPRAIYITARAAGGQKLPGLVVKIHNDDTGTDAFTKVTSANGNCFVQHAPAGNYTAFANKYGYAPKKLACPVNDGETTHLEFVLTPEAE